MNTTHRQAGCAQLLSSHEPEDARRSITTSRYATQTHLAIRALPDALAPKSPPPHAHLDLRAPATRPPGGHPSTGHAGCACGANAWLRLFQRRPRERVGSTIFSGNADDGCSGPARSPGCGNLSVGVGIHHLGRDWEPSAIIGVGASHPTATSTPSAFTRAESYGPPYIAIQVLGDASHPASPGGRASRRREAALQTGR